MRIVDRKTFLAMPAGTLFSKYEPCVFGELLIKGESLTNDFIVQSIADAIACNSSSDFTDKLQLSQECGLSIGMDFTCAGRDGCFDEDQLFAVWDRKDVEALISRLLKTLK